MRRGLGARHIVVHVRAPSREVPIHAQAFGRLRDSELVALSRELLPSLGIRLGRSWRSTLGVHLVWSGVNVLDRGRDMHRALVTSDASLNLHSVSLVDLATHQTSVVRGNRLRGVPSRIADAIAVCVDQAIK